MPRDFGKDEGKRLEILNELEVDVATMRERIMNRPASRPVRQKGSWTVLVYMAAYGALRPFAERDLFEMSMAEDSPDVRIVAQVQWEEDREHKRYRVKHGEGNTYGFVQTPEHKEAMASRFAQFLKDEIPPQASGRHHRCLLVLWGHAVDGQFGGFGDHGMDLKQIASAIAAHSAGRRLDILGFDACDMSRLETIHEFKGLATFLVGSQISVPFSGWPYHTILRGLVDDPGMDERTLSNMILEEYYFSYQPPRITLTALHGRLERGYEGLQENVEALAGAMQKVLSDPLVDVLRDTFLDTRKISPDPLLDLRDFCVTLRDNLNSSLTMPAADKKAIMAALGEVIDQHDRLISKHERRGPMVARLNGIGFSPHTLTRAWDRKYLSIYDRVGWRHPR
jgi:hypothetical protein